MYKPNKGKKMVAGRKPKPESAARPGKAKGTINKRPKRPTMKPMSAKKKK